jgi:hypothetical protein
MRHFHGAFTGTRIPRIRKTVWVTIAGSDGVVLRAFEVSLAEDTELAAAIAVGEMVEDMAGEENVTDVTVATALRASLIDESNANNSPFAEEDPSEFEDGTSASWETL